MDGVWLTYHDLADRLGTSAEGARRRAQRGRWTRQRGNDGLARVMVPNDALDAPRAVRAPSARGDEEAAAPALVDALRGQLVALESHIKTLQADKEALTQDLTTTRADLSAHVDMLKAQLASAEARAGEEAAKTAQAIAAFEQLAQRLEALAEARRPWWRRLVG
jgi:DNA repair exonuclease SbcCD ATPase subunit